MKITEIDCSTGTETVRDMTKEEIAAYELQKQNALDEAALDESQAL